MRISDWSSDVCSSDLPCGFGEADLAGRWSLRGAVQQRDDDFPPAGAQRDLRAGRKTFRAADGTVVARSEEHTSELQSLMRISYAVFCLKKKKNTKDKKKNIPPHTTHDKFTLRTSHIRQHT